MKGRHNLYNHLELTLRNAEDTVTMITTTQGLVRKIEGLRPIFEQLNKRGVTIRICAPLITKESLKAADEMKDVADVRHTDSKARFTIVDGKELFFMVLDDTDVHPSYDVGIWVNTPFFATALEELFELAWKEMVKPAKLKIAK
jgi:sugar-specific transcriptional regulator TrmB